MHDACTAMTTPSNNHVRALSTATAQQLSAGQVITSLASAAKELVENALDAGATVVEVRLQSSAKAGASQQMPTLMVRDHGRGVAHADRALLCRRAHTSKLEAMEDLTRISSYGFRGISRYRTFRSITDVHSWYDII
jgi:DNA mismatch repair ATPase MutL